MHDGRPSGSAIALWSILFIFVLVAVIVGGCLGAPQYRVYRQDKAGEARLREAEQDRQIAVVEAQAELEAAELQHQTDVERAKGIAEANEIIGESITTEYLLWRWIEGLHDGNGEIIYVPTEANLPVLEAMRQFIAQQEAALPAGDVD